MELQNIFKNIQNFILVITIVIFLSIYLLDLIYENLALNELIN